MSNIEPSLAHQPGDPLPEEEAEPNQHQGCPGHLQQERFECLQVCADKTRRGAEGNERRAETGYEQQSVAEQVELLGQAGAAAFAGRPSTHVSDVGRHQGQDAGRREGQEAGGERQHQVENHAGG